MTLLARQKQKRCRGWGGGGSTFTFTFKTDTRVSPEASRVASLASSSADLRSDATHDAPSKTEATPKTIQRVGTFRAKYHTSQVATRANVFLWCRVSVSAIFSTQKYVQTTTGLKPLEMMDRRKQRSDTACAAESVSHGGIMRYTPVCHDVCRAVHPCTGQ